MKSLILSALAFFAVVSHAEPAVYKTQFYAHSTDPQATAVVGEMNQFIRIAKSYGWTVEVTAKTRNGETPVSLMDGETPAQAVVALGGCKAFDDACKSALQKANPNVNLNSSSGMGFFIMPMQTFNYFLKISAGKEYREDRVANDRLKVTMSRRFFQLTNSGRYSGKMMDDRGTCIVTDGVEHDCFYVDVVVE